MSGWIKVEKDLETDPRVLRMARALARQFGFFPTDVLLDACNAVALPAVTLVVGALTRLWIYGDSHARADDTLDLGPAEIDEWLGIPGFCALMPPDWLRVIDENTVELPGFHDHNGVEARKKALGAKRVQAHRERKKRESVSTRNADALPDQTRPDQTKIPPHPPTLPPAPPARPAQPQTRGGEDAWRDVGADATAYERWLEWRQSVHDPVPAVRRIAEAKFLAAKGSPEQQRAFVEEIIRLGFKTMHDPIKPRSTERAGPTKEQREESERKELEQLYADRATFGVPGFRKPHPGESPDVYRTAMKLAARNARPAPAVAALVGGLARKVRGDAA